jgi:radical SAM superfamily enzyme YgiQ (UPF0313 family)
MRVTFIQPKVGSRPGHPYPATWKMEPLWAAALSAVTPAAIARDFFDDRLGPLPFDHATDLVAISVETYTARRSYQIAARFRARGVPVVLGGMHATLRPDEAARHVDAIVTGPGEVVWPELLRDFQAGAMKPRYDGVMPRSWGAPQPDRSLYAHLRYGRLSLVETSRGCAHACEFCSISSFFARRFVPRPIPEVVEDLRRTRAKYVFFVDDNLVVDPRRLRELCEAITPLGLHWFGQIGIQVAEDEELLRAMQRSGCAGVLIGFESLNPANLASMCKPVTAPARYEQALARLRRHGLSVYATFVFGYDGDTEASFVETLRFAVEQKFFFAAFNHLVPFPGTPLHARLRADGRLLDETWWLDGGYRFGDVAFRPAQMEPAELSRLCAHYRRRFYGARSVCARAEFRANLNSPLKAVTYLHQNIVARGEVDRRLGLPLGE